MDETPQHNDQIIKRTSKCIGVIPFKWVQKCYKSYCLQDFTFKTLLVESWVFCIHALNVYKLWIACQELNMHVCMLKKIVLHSNINYIHRISPWNPIKVLYPFLGSCYEIEEGKGQGKVSSKLKSK